MDGEKSQYDGPPEFYNYFQVAHICNCKPWELLDVPFAWREWAYIIATAEREAREDLAAREEQKHGS